VTLLVRNGRVVDPVSGFDAALDILIRDGKFVAVKPRLDGPAERTIDASGLVVVPGLIDMHVHLREPGFEEKETIRSGSRAAAKGGFTTVCCMPNTRPVNDRPSVTASIVARAERTAVVNVLPIAAVTLDQKGIELVDMAGLAAAGAVAFSDDGRPVEDDEVMRRALRTAHSLGKVVIDHCEDLALSRGGIIHDGKVASRLGLKGISSDSESNLVARDVRLSEETGAPVHIAHLSVADAVASVREARGRGVRVSAEATPHHLFLTESALEGRDPDFKMNPPLRSAADNAALIEAVATGVIEVIATDHAPHTPSEKAGGLEKAPFGVVGLETAVSLVLDRLVRPGTISLTRFAELLSASPARLLGLANKGRIQVGADADLTLLDLQADVVVERQRFESKSRNTPFEGWRLRGGPAMTIVGGKIVFPFREAEAEVPGATG
jgi:dihydroorotase